MYMQVTFSTLIAICFAVNPDFSIIIKSLRVKI